MFFFLYHDFTYFGHFTFSQSSAEESGDFPWLLNCDNLGKVTGRSSQGTGTAFKKHAHTTPVPQ